MVAGVREPGSSASNLILLAFAFLKAGVVSFGGGASIIPILRHELVTRNGWMSQDEFLDAYMLGSTMPGPIGTNLAAYFGKKIAGWPGAIISITATVVPTALAMIGLATLYFAHRDNPIISGMLSGIRPVVIALLLVVVWDFLPAAIGPRATWHKYPLRWLLVAVIFILGVQFEVNAAVLIVIGGTVGLLFLRS